MKRMAEAVSIRNAARQLGVSIRFVYDLVWSGNSQPRRWTKCGGSPPATSKPDSRGEVSDAGHCSSTPPIGRGGQRPMRLAPHSKSVGQEGQASARPPVPPTLVSPGRNRTISCPGAAVTTMPAGDNLVPGHEEALNSLFRLRMRRQRSRIGQRHSAQPPFTVSLGNWSERYLRSQKPILRRF